MLSNRLHRVESRRGKGNDPPLLIIDNSRGELDPVEKARLIAQAETEGKLVVVLRNPCVAN